jgi:hypothetical protein
MKRTSLAVEPRSAYLVAGAGTFTGTRGAQHPGRGPSALLDLLQEFQIVVRFRQEGLA